MSDKLTDNEIIKALECCCLIDPKTIFLRDDKTGEITTLNVNDIFYLITRQQAEIERLRKTEIEIDDFCRRLCRMRMLNGRAIASYDDLQNYIQYKKSEAVKEFADKVVHDINTYCEKNIKTKPSVDGVTGMKIANDLI